MRLLITLCLVIITSSCEFSEKKLPEKVIQNFQSRFPNAKTVKWEKEKEMYEAEFSLNDTEVSALFDKNGNMLEVETEISPQQLPPEIVNSIAQQFPEFRVIEGAKIESNQPVIYEVEIQSNSEEKKFFFDSKGKILKEEKKDN